MNSEQYVESIKQMMSQQNNFFAIFLAILAIVLTFAGILQWRLSNKQIQQIKEETKAETIADIEKIISVSDLHKLKDEISFPLIERMEKGDKFGEDILHYERSSLDLAFLNLHRSPFPIGDLVLLIDVYSPYLKRNVENLNYFMSKIEKLLEHDNIGLSKPENIPSLKVAFDKLLDIENSLNKESFKLKKFWNTLEL